MNKKIVVFAAALAVTPTFAQAQEIDAQPGFYIGAGGGITTPLSSPNNSTGVGPVVGGKIGYDFVGPRVDLDVGYGQTPLNVNIPGTAITGKAGQLTGLVNLSYDFFPTSLEAGGPDAVVHRCRRRYRLHRQQHLLGQHPVRLGRFGGCALQHQQLDDGRR